MRIAAGLLLAAIVVLGGCKGEPKKGESPPAPGAPSAAAGARSGSAPGARPGAEKRGEAEKVKEEARQFLARWVAAQKQLDFPAYAALYEPRTFRGVKRTASGKVVEYDLAGWKRDRRRMFQRGFEVAAEPLGIETWLDRGSKLKRGMIVVRFLQRWRSARYADHGLKVLHLWRAPDGRLWITYEDLLNSEPGWERVAPEVATAELPVPADDAAALALWKKLAPTGANYEAVLASIPEDEAIRRPMARALLAGGNFECKNIVQYDECGTEYVEWGDFDPKAGFDDPCLRRRLALWALGEVEDEDMPALEPVLVAMAGLGPPEGELPSAVADAVVGAPERLKLAVYGALAASGREEEVTVTGLSEAGLIAAATQHGIDAAALELHEVRHTEEMASLLNDDRLSAETRAALVAKLEGVKHPAVEEGLIELTGGEDCSLAMEAALVLDRRGDPSHLPRRSISHDGPATFHVVCMLMHDPNRERAERRLAELIGPEGVAIEETIEDPWAEATAGDGGPEGEGDAEQPNVVTTIGELMPYLEQVYAEDKGDWDRADYSLARGKDGGWYISRVELYRYNGCGC